MTDESKPYRRRAAPERAELKERILGTARELFTREGIDAVSMRNGASQVDLTPMGLYRYFASKHDLVLHIWGDVFEELAVHCHGAAVHRRSAVTRLHAFVEAFIDYWLEHPGRFQMIFSSAETRVTGDGAESFFSHASAVAALTREWDALVEASRRERGRPQGDVRHARELMFCQAIGLLTVLIGSGAGLSADPERLRSAVVAHMLADG